MRHMCDVQAETETVVVLNAFRSEQLLLEVTMTRQRNNKNIIQITLLYYYYG